MGSLARGYHHFNVNLSEVLYRFIKPNGPATVPFQTLITEGGWQVEESLSPALEYLEES